MTQNIEYVELCRKYEKEIEDLNELLLLAKNCNKLLNDSVTYYLCNGVPEMKELMIENERLRKLVNNETDQIFQIETRCNINRKYCARYADIEKLHTTLKGEHNAKNDSTTCTTGTK